MIEFREATSASDRFFVVSSWTQSYRTANTAGFIQAEDWYRVMDEQVAKAMTRPDVRTIVAYEGDGLYGFITADLEERPPLVYYVYVKEAYRRGRGRLWNGPGLARQLFAAVGVDPARPFYFVCSTPMVRTLERKIPMAAWKPLFGRFPKHERKTGR